MMRFWLAAALLPAGVLMFIIYRMDTAEKESRGLLTRLFLCGAVACIPAMILENIGMPLVEQEFGTEGLRSVAWQAFAVVGVSEELCKFFFLRRLTWRCPEFNYRFDGIVYAVFVTLGFAALENVMYLFGYGPDVLVARGLLSIPGHATFGVFMGFYYTQGKLADVYGEVGRRRKYLWLALLMPAVLHGFFDFCLMSEDSTLSMVFFLFVIVLDVICVKLVRRESQRDRSMMGPDWSDV